MSAQRVHWLALLLSLSLLYCGEGSARRTKRNLLFTPGGTYCQLITGIGVPIPLPHRSMTMGVVLKYNYDLPQNATELLQPYARSLRGRRGRGQVPGRWAVYQGLEDALDSLDAGVDSHQCLLRTICEAAAVPFDPHSGLAAELVHILLTPSTSNEVQGSQPERDYAAAERSGRGGAEGCAPFRKGCPLPLLQMFSRLSALGAALG